MEDGISEEYKTQMIALTEMVPMLSELEQDIGQVIRQIKSGKRLFTEEQAVLEYLTTAWEAMSNAAEVAAEETDYPIWIDGSYGGVYPEGFEAGPPNRFAQER